MGQRFQSVFILPSVYMNENNPNNRSEKIKIFHNQWLFGYSALKVNLLIVERLKEAIQKRHKKGKFGKSLEGFKNHFLERVLYNSIRWASVQDINDETEFKNSAEKVYKDDGKDDTLGEILAKEDNNNGFFICRINEDLSLQYCFISGLENTGKHEIKTPEEYFKLFYEFEELDNEDKASLYDILNRFEKFKDFGLNFDGIISEMNKIKEPDKIQ